MNVFVRMVVVLFVILSTYFFSYWVLFSVEGLDLSMGLRRVGATIVAALAGWYVGSKLRSKDLGMVQSIIVGAFATGGVTFMAGFFGPMILVPEANQGPLLGLFITGPAGFVLGGIAGALHWKVKQSKGSTGTDIEPME